MKKRLFAGALALLMIIGLLPVSSMLKKPVEVQAATNEFTPNNYSETTFNNGIVVGGDSDYFKIYGKSSMGVKKNSLSWNVNGSTEEMESYFSTAGKMAYSNVKINGSKVKKVTGAIGFTTQKKATIKVYWSAKNKDISLKCQIIDSNDSLSSISNGEVKPATQTEEYNPAAEYTTFSVNPEGKSETYYLGGSDAVNIYKILVVEESNYPVKIFDSKAPRTETETGVNNAGDEITLKAADSSANFRYWENSEGIIVSRSPEVTIPVYYGDTYTAVYKDNGAVVNYLTSYGQVLYTYTEDEYKALTAEPAGPVRYGYAFNGWSKNVGDDEVIAALEAKNSYDITPNYDSAQDTYEITINTEALGGSSVTKSYRVNEVVTATVSSDNFACWKDETGKIVSYSPTYLFFANKKTTVTAFGGSAGKEDDAKAVITTVSSEKASDGSPVVIFEYNIPAGYHIDFAGVLASKTLSGDSLTVENRAYVIGDSDLSYTTYRYTVKSKSGVTWNIKPMLKYTYNGKTYTIYGNPITLN